MYKLDLEKAEEPEINCQHTLDHRKSKEITKKIYFWFIDYTKAYDWMDHNQLWNILKHIGMPDHIPCLLRNLVCRTRSNNWNWIWNNEVVQNWERNTSRL